MFGMKRYPFGEHGYRKGGDGGASQMRADEERRNATVRKNVEDINLQFSGRPASKRGAGAQTSSFLPGQTYYDATGNPVIPVSNAPAPVPGSSSIDGYLAATMPSSVIKAAPKPKPLYTGVEDVAAVPGFDDNYFKNVADAYLNYQTPLLQEQAAVARRNLPGRFATTSSSAYQRELANLERDISREQTNLADKSLDFANQQRGSVENARSDLIGMANSGTDASSLATQTAARMAALSKPPAYSPIADLFSKYAAQAGTYMQADALGALNRNGGSLFFGAPSNSVKTIG